MPELPDYMAYGPGSAMPSPVVGALVPFVLGPFTTAATVATGAGEMGFYAPCDLRIESVSWSAMTYGGAGSTLAVFKHTAIDGATAGTSILAAIATTAGGRAEGASLSTVAGARNVTKGQYVAMDPVIGTSAATNMTITVMASVVGHAVADVAAR